MIASPAPRRPAPGGGLAVLVVVTVLAALAAPHAQPLRGLVAGCACRYRRARASCRARPAVELAGRLGRWRSPSASGASPTGGAPKAPAPSTARG